MEIDLISKLVHDCLHSRLDADQGEEEQHVFFNYENQTLEIYTMMEGFDGSLIKFPNVKAKHIKSKGVWKVYCMGQSMVWKLYQPNPEVEDIYEFLKLIDEDKHGIFWG